MVQLLPLWIGDGERALPAEYVYAVGTAPECRGQGLAARLLDCARQTCSLRGGQALALIPQQPSLFGYYRRLGYQTAFWAEERKIQPRPLPSGWTLNRAAEGDLAQKFLGQKGRWRRPPPWLGWAQIPACVECREKAALSSLWAWLCR